MFSKMLKSCLTFWFQHLVSSTPISPSFTSCLLHSNDTSYRSDWFHTRSHRYPIGYHFNVIGNFQSTLNEIADDSRKKSLYVQYPRYNKGIDEYFRSFCVLWPYFLWPHCDLISFDLLTGRLPLVLYLICPFYAGPYYATAQCFSF